mmetsp:Transcript_23168/g.35540  ORF Transcript_23168/g.35540 Transcript_23168/m.35540 type:complete len:90 (-) Transcript_23168:443-712(-)
MSNTLLIAKCSISLFVSEANRTTSTTFALSIIWEEYLKNTKYKSKLFEGARLARKIADHQAASLCLLQFNAENPLECPIKIWSWTKLRA